MTNIKILLPSLLFAFLFTPKAQAYPDFIGYGYSSCITCHFNGLGGGALTDYGRAIFAGDITARDVYSAKTDEDEIAEMSGFLGKTELPWWVRPGIKYRGLWVRTNPNSGSDTQRYINMQNDVNLNFLLDKKQTITLVNTVSYTGTGEEAVRGKTNYWFMKEYYVRYKQNNNLWFYAGQMDKVFGVRFIDHTAVNRSPLGLGQFDQSQGVIAHVTFPNWDVAANAFFGNGDEEAADKMKGFSLGGEYQVVEKWKIGASALTQKNEATKWNLLAFYTRMGLSKGTALIAEWGLKEKTALTGTDTDAKLGSYGILQAMVNLRRGYNLVSTIEQSREDIKEPSSESTRWKFGFMIFPLPRTEIRILAANRKTLVETGGSPDAWSLQSQLHLSF
ncbi:hypothetical protein D3C72_1119980 [compost metagenome]